MLNRTREGGFLRAAGLVQVCVEGHRNIADKGTAETESTPVALTSKDFYLRVTVKAGAICTFSYSVDGKAFTNVGEPFKAREGRWIGAKVGFVFNRPARFNDAGSADIDWFRFEK